ncbi:MAG TPA: 50S ribosomal protein L23 [Planctomycetota bacterium]|nr:50S ribosomal protein L23 [Planctomycetota bacterium]
MKEMNAYQVVVRPLVTEKAIGQESENTYWFAVHVGAGKTQIRKAVEEIYQVHVRNVRTLRQKGKLRRARYKLYRTPEWKKAAVTLAPGERIDII